MGLLINRRSGISFVRARLFFVFLVKTWKKKKKLRIVVALVAPASQWGEVVRISSNKLNVFGGLFFFFRHFFFLICHLLQNAISLVIFSIFVLLATLIFDWHLRSDRWIPKLPTIDWRISASWTGTLRLAHCQYSRSTRWVALHVASQHKVGWTERYVIRHVESALRVFVLDLVRCWTSFFFKRKKKKMKHRFSFSYLSAF